MPFRERPVCIRLHFIVHVVVDIRSIGTNMVQSLRRGGILLLTAGAGLVLGSRGRQGYHRILRIRFVGALGAEDVAK